MALQPTRLHVDVRGLRGRGGGHAWLLYVPLVAALGQGTLLFREPRRIHAMAVARPSAGLTTALQIGRAHV